MHGPQLTVVGKRYCKKVNLTIANSRAVGPAVLPCAPGSAHQLISPGQYPALEEFAGCAGAYASWRPGHYQVTVLQCGELAQFLQDGGRWIDHHIDTTGLARFSVNLELQ